MSDNETMRDNEPEEVVKKRKRIIDHDSELEPDGETAEPQIVEPTNKESTAVPEVLTEQPYEPPGPKSTKKSAQILKEIEVRTILQSAVIISADGSEAQSRKKKIRVLEDSDEEKEEAGKVDIDDIGKAEEQNVVKEEPVESEDAEIVIADRLEEVEQTENGVEEPDANDGEKNGTELSDEDDENNSEQEMENGEDEEDAGEKSDQEVDDAEQSGTEPDQMDQGSENEDLEGSKENDDEAATDNENAEPGAENAVEKPLQNGISNQDGSENDTNDEQPDEEEQEDVEEGEEGEEEEASDASECNDGERASEERVYEKPGPRSTKKRPELCEEKRYERPGPKCTKKQPEIASDHEDDNLPVDLESEEGEENQSEDSQPNDEDGEEENGENSDSDEDSTLETEPEPEVVIQATRFTVYSGIPDPLNPPRRMSPNSRRRQDRRQRQTSSSEYSSTSETSESDSETDSETPSERTSGESSDESLPPARVQKPSHYSYSHSAPTTVYRKPEVKQQPPPKKKDIPNSVFFDMRVPLNQLIHESDSSESEVEIKQEASNYKYRKKVEMVQRRPIVQRRPQPPPPPPKPKSRGEKLLDRMKYFLKLAGMKNTNLELLFKHCRTYEEQANKVLELLRHELDDEEPTVENCKELRIIRQIKRETAELDTSLIIEKEGRTRRSARKTEHPPPPVKKEPTPGVDVAVSNTMPTSEVPAAVADAMPVQEVPIMAANTMPIPETPVTICNMMPVPETGAAIDNMVNTITTIADTLDRIEGVVDRGVGGEN